MLKKHTFGFMAIAAMIVTTFVFTGCPDPTGPGPKPNPGQQETSDVFRMLWKGELQGAPTNPVAGWVYFNLDDQKLYVYYNNGWNQLGADGAASAGAQGPAGPAGSQGPAGASPTVEIKDEGGVKYWFIDNVNTNVKAEGVDGASGTLNSVLTIGANGNWLIDGHDTGRPASTQLSWQGNHQTAPANPQNGWLYYNVTAKAAYIYLNGSWSQFAQDGLNGSGGGGGGISSVQLFIDDGTGDLYLTIDGGAPQNIGNVRSSGSNSCVVTHNWAWKAIMPIQVLANIREEERCADCGAVTGKTRWSYTNFQTWLSEQSGGTSSADTIEVVLAIPLGSSSAELSAGCNELQEISRVVKKYVDLDLSLCSSPSTFNFVFNYDAYFGDYIRSVILPNAATIIANTNGEWGPSITGIGITTINADSGYHPFGDTVSRINFPALKTVQSYAFNLASGLTSITIGRNCTITNTGHDARFSAFATYYAAYNSSAGGARAAGTYTWDGSAWTGPR